MRHSLRTIPFASLFMLAVFSTNVQADEKILATPEFEKENTSSEDKNWNFELGGGVMYVS